MRRDLTRSADDSGDRTLNLWRLRFHDRRVEREFRTQYARQVRLQSRLALLLAAALYLLLGFEDYWFFPERGLAVMAIRVLVAISLLSAYAFISSAQSTRFDQSVLLLQFLLGGCGVLVMIAMAAPPAANSYYVGLLLTVVWAYSCSGLRFYPAFAVNLLLIGAYVLLQVVEQVPHQWLFTNTGNLCAGSLIVAFAGYLIEWQRRVMFHQTLTIERDRRNHEQMALYDLLTGLPNRLLFEQRLAKALHRVRDRNARMAVLFVDIDRLKPVNDMLGHQVGDMVLSKLASRISESVRHQDTVARIGGDEFLVLVEDVRGREDVSAIVTKVLYGVQKPFAVRDASGEVRLIRMTASVGAALYPEDGTDGDDLIRQADAEMYRAKIARRASESPKPRRRESGQQQPAGEPRDIRNAAHRDVRSEAG